MTSNQLRQSESGKFCFFIRQFFQLNIFILNQIGYRQQFIFFFPGETRQKHVLPQLVRLVMIYDKKYALALAERTSLCGSEGTS